MPTAPSSPIDAEATRLGELLRLGLLDTPRESEFDAVVTIASRLFRCPISTVTLVDAHRQWFKAGLGLEGDGCSREHSICATAIGEPDLLIVPDLRADPRFRDNPIVRDGPEVRFYAGAPLRPGNPSVSGVGTLCIMDTTPRSFPPADAELLRQLARTVCAVMQARAAAAASTDLSAALRNHAEVIRLQNAQLRQAERMVGIGSWRFDARDGSIVWSDQVFAIHELPVGPVPPFEVAMAHYPFQARDHLQHLLERARAAGEAFDFESDFITAAGRLRRVRSMGEPQIVDGMVTAIVGVFQDVTDRHTLEKQLRATADTDMLTGLPNRRALDRYLAQAVSEACAADTPLAVILLDLDGFKQVNDVLGHDAGDEVLRGIAERLREGALRHAYAARLGGDEFVLVATRPRDCARLEALLGALLQEVRHTVQRGNRSASVSVTAGAARLEARGQSVADLLRSADIALYQAKRHRRGSAFLHGSESILGSVAGAPDG